MEYHPKGLVVAKFLMHTPLLVGRPASMKICVNGLFKRGKGTKLELATSPPPSWGAKSGRKCYITPVFAGVPNKGNKIRIGCLTLPSQGAKILRKCYYHGVTEVAKTANIPKMAEKCINCISARPTPPHTNPIELGPGNTFSAQNRKKTKRFMICDPKKGGGVIF